MFQDGAGNLTIFALAKETKNLSHIAVEPFVGVLADNLGIVETDEGWLESNDSPRGESILVAWNPKIFHEVRDGAPRPIRLF